MTESAKKAPRPDRSARATIRGYLFEMLVADLLRELGFSDVRLTSGPDQGIDILAEFPIKQPAGDLRSQLWVIQVKHRPSSRIQARDIAQLSGMFQVKGADKALLVTSGHLTSAAMEYASRFRAHLRGELEVWDRTQLGTLLSRFPHLLKKYEPLVSEFPLSATPAQSKHAQLIEQLHSIKAGRDSWRDYEVCCVSILKESLVPPLKPPREQARTWSGLERRDSLFSLRGIGEGWQSIREEFSANFLLCEFKNYVDPFGKDEVNQTRNYLKSTIGRLGIIFSRRGPDNGAVRMRNSIFSEERKVILFFDDSHLVELLRLRAAKQPPLDLIQDAIDEFYLEYE